MTVICIPLLLLEVWHYHWHASGWQIYGTRQGDEGSRSSYTLRQTAFQDKSLMLSAQRIMVCTCYFVMCPFWDYEANALISTEKLIVIQLANYYMEPETAPLGPLLSQISLVHSLLPVFLKPNLMLTSSGHPLRHFGCLVSIGSSVGRLVNDDLKESFHDLFVILSPNFPKYTEENQERTLDGWCPSCYKQITSKFEN